MDNCKVDSVVSHLQQDLSQRCYASSHPGGSTSTTHTVNGSGDNLMDPEKTTETTYRHDRGELQRGITSTSKNPEFCERNTDDTLRTFQGDNEVKKGNLSVLRERRSRSFCHNFLTDGCSRGASSLNVPSEYTSLISSGYDWCVKLHQGILATSENPGESFRNPEVVKTDQISSSKINLIFSTDTNDSVLSKEANAEMNIDPSQEKGEKVCQVLKTAKKKKLCSKYDGTQLDICSSSGLDSTTTVLDKNAINQEIAKPGPTSSSKMNLISSTDTDSIVLNKNTNAEMDIAHSEEKDKEVPPVLKTLKKRKLRSNYNGTELDMCLSSGQATAKPDPTSSSQTNLISSMDTNSIVLNKKDCSEEKDEVPLVLKTSKKKKLRSKCNGTELDMCLSSGQVIAKPDPTSPSQTKLISSTDTNSIVLNKKANAEIDINRSEGKDEDVPQVLKSSKKKKLPSKCNGTELDTCLSSGQVQVNAKLDPTSSSQTNLISSMDTNSIVLDKKDCSEEKDEVPRVLKISKKKKLRSKCNGTELDMCLSSGQVIEKPDPTSSSKTNLISSTDTNSIMLIKIVNAKIDINCSEEKDEEVPQQVLKTSKKNKLRSKCTGKELDMCLSSGQVIAKPDPTSSSKTNLISSKDTNSNVLNKKANVEMDIGHSLETDEEVPQVLKTSKERKLRSKCDGTELDICLGSGLDLATTVPVKNARNQEMAKTDLPSSSKTNFVSSMDTNASVLDNEANVEMYIVHSEKNGEKASQVLKNSKKRKLRSKCNGTQQNMCSHSCLDVTTTVDKSARNQEIANPDPTSSSKTDVVFFSMDTNAIVLNKEANAQMDIDCSQAKGEKVRQVLKTSKKRKQHSSCNETQLDMYSSGSLHSVTTVLEKNVAEANVVKNALTTNNSVQEPYSSTETVSIPNRKLLVLDVNGLLADITSDTLSIKCKPHAWLNGKAVYKRRFCEDFIDFCFERFDVGIWSSRHRSNVDKVVDLLMGGRKKHLLFCWDQSYCTSTGSRTLENYDKPLVLKELKKLWEKDRPEVPWEKGCYNEKNTVLLDDSPYKALSNPPYTAVFPHPFSASEPFDESIGPNGNIRQYLTRLADAKDVQEFIRENPFGQAPITESARWDDFYSKIIPKIKAREENNQALQRIWKKH